MKKLLPLLLFCLVACQPDEPSKPIIVDGGSPDGSKTTRPRNKATSWNGGVTGSSVSLADIYAFIERDCPTTKGAQPSQASVVPYVDEQGLDTLMYIVNYPGNAGWKVLSADSRTPAIIAEGDKGSFDLNGADGAVAAWMSCVATDMKRVRHAQDEDLNFSDIEIACNKAFWTGEAPQPKGPGGPPTPDPYQGHWEDTIIDAVSEFVDSCGHLTPQWDQDMPYNEFCPFKTNSSTEHKPAGCVAIAGAEVLYYLHSRLGIPEEMVSQASYNSSTNEWSFSAYTDSVWVQMDTTSLGVNNTNRPEAIMIGHIGKIINMHYQNNYSWAIPANLRTNLFYPNGIGCDHGSYNESIVANSLVNLMPVIIIASNYLIPTDFNIHCFVADAYYRTRTKYTHLHHWVGESTPPDPGEGSIIIEPDDYYTFSYSSAIVSGIKINWGWWTQWYPGLIGDQNLQGPLNDGWYTLTAGWTVTTGSGEVYDYNHNVSMIYGFNISE